MEEERPFKRRRRKSGIVSDNILLEAVNGELKFYFELLGLRIYNAAAYEKKFAPFKLGGEERDNISRYSFWPSHSKELPLLYVAAHEVLCGPGSSVSCERLNSAVLLTITLLRNRLNGINKEILFLAKEKRRIGLFTGRMYLQ